MFDCWNAAYMDVLNNADSCCISFDCTWPCKFLETLEYDYPSVFATVNTGIYKDRQKGNAQIDACTDEIFISATNSYGIIHIKKYDGEQFSVNIEIRSSAFVNNKPDNVSNVFRSAASKMG